MRKSRAPRHFGCAVERIDTPATRLLCRASGRIDCQRLKLRASAADVAGKGRTGSFGPEYLDRPGGKGSGTGNQSRGDG